MSSIRSGWKALTLATALLVAGSAVGDEKPAAEKPTERILQREELASVQEAAASLVRELENLQEQISFEAGDAKQRALFAQVDGALARAVHFQDALKFGVSRATLYQYFDEMDKRLHEVSKGVLEAGSKNANWQRAADRLTMADIGLHYALSQGDISEERQVQMMARQADALVFAAKELQRAAHFAAGTNPKSTLVEPAVAKLVKAAQAFHQATQAGKSRQQLSEDFKTVNQVWEEVLLRVRDLDAKDQAYLLRSAARLDRVHDHLYKLLKIEGKRSSLTVQT
ncbi:MAG: hypothetical protein JNM56_38880 [Planctomycetia bacterium]|nr:hypothetical protein [Planctomycetia bacterium]